MSSENLSLEHSELILDGTKIAWHEERFKAWERGERIAPITVDIAITRSCNYGCHFCYAMLQENDKNTIDLNVITRFLEDCSEIGVKGISLVGDGENTQSPIFIDTIIKGSELGIDMACATNALTLNKSKLKVILPHMTYLRVNFSAGEAKRYAEIMGCKEKWFDRVCQNIRDMMEIKKKNNLKVTIGMQMVVMPEYHDQIIPLAKLGKELQPDYLVLKHCSDDEEGSLGVKYSKYKDIFNLLKEAETYSDDQYKVVVKWSKIEAEGKRSYQRCYGTPFLIQISGTGLIAPCSIMFNEKYKKFHLGNICEDRFKDIVFSDDYWEVMNRLASPSFNAQTMCGTLCLQHKFNEAIDNHVKGISKIEKPKGSQPQHINFI